MANIEQLAEKLTQRFSSLGLQCVSEFGELTIEVPRENFREVCFILRDEKAFKFEQLMDVTGVDYLHYGITEWQTEETTFTGFSRAVDKTWQDRVIPWNKPRFAAVYHLLSITNNHRLRLRVFADTDPPVVESVVDIWSSANWYEREAFDLYGILFANHPDLRRILTDYGFIGYPFRKDFPLIGEIEMRYDATLQRCVYEPVSIQPRTLVPKVIRDDSRYLSPEDQKSQ
jgi:NADH-quinone oxidoreductase subunit C